MSTQFCKITEQEKCLTISAHFAICLVKMCRRKNKFHSFLHIAFGTFEMMIEFSYGFGKWSSFRRNVNSRFNYIEKHYCFIDAISKWQLMQKWHRKTSNEWLCMHIFFWVDFLISFRPHLTTSFIEWSIPFWDPSGLRFLCWIFMANDSRSHFNFHLYILCVRYSFDFSSFISTSANRFPRCFRVIEI